MTTIIQLLSGESFRVSESVEEVTSKRESADPSADVVQLTVASSGQPVLIAKQHLVAWHGPLDA